jgi:DNA-binding CsgD family transcriptional regulator
MSKPLTVRESQVLAILAIGATNAEIGSQLGITEKTVKNICLTIFGKLDVQNRVQAALTFHNIPWRT